MQANPLTGPSRLVQRWWDTLPEADQGILSACGLLAALAIVVVGLALVRLW
jgi:hypothetical protein